MFRNVIFYKDSEGVKMKQEEFEELIKKLDGEIIDVAKPVKTVAQAVSATNSSPKQIIKSLLFISENEPVLVILDGESRVDLKKLTKLVGKVRFASPEEVKQITGFEVGAVPPIGIKIKTIVDKKVLENKFVIGGGGRIDRLIRLIPDKIIQHQKAIVEDVRKE